MDPLFIRYVRAGAIHLLLAAVVTAVLAHKHMVHVAMARDHLAVMGFAFLTLSGLCYQAIVSTLKHDLFSPRAAAWQFWLQNLGVIGWAIAIVGKGDLPSGPWRGGLIVSSFTEVTAIVLFSFQIYMSVKDPMLIESEIESRPPGAPPA